MRIISCCFSILILLNILALVQAKVPKKLHLVTGNEYAPYTGQSLPEGGMITEIIKLVMKEMHHDITIDFVPWGRGYLETKKLKYFATFPYAKTSERMKDFDYSDPIVTIRTALFVKHDSKLKYETQKDLKNTTFCKALGYNTSDVKELIDKKYIRILRPRTLSLCFTMLLRGRVDTVPISDLIGWELIDSLGYDRKKFRTLKKYLTVSKLYLIISKTNPHGKEFLKEFNKVLKSFFDKKIIQKIIKKHLGK